MVEASIIVVNATSEFLNESEYEVGPTDLAVLVCCDDGLANLSVDWTTAGANAFDLVDRDRAFLMSRTSGMYEPAPELERVTMGSGME